MLDHIGFSVSNMKVSRIFYEKALKPLGITPLMKVTPEMTGTSESHVGFGAGRPFFWIGPRKTGDVCSDFARRIAQAERSGDPVLRVGNLEVVRDFLDIDDGIRGLVCLAERGQAGDVYNICSGHGYRVGDILERLKARARIAIEDRADPALWRSIDERVRIGDPGKLKSLGWDATVSMDNALTRLLEYWRSRSPE